jgi:hypothetical protein
VVMRKGEGNEEGGGVVRRITDTRVFDRGEIRSRKEERVLSHL